MIRLLCRSIFFILQKYLKVSVKVEQESSHWKKVQWKNLHIHASCCCICLQFCDVLVRWKSNVFQWCLCCKERKILNRDDLLRLDTSDARRHVAGVRNLIIAKFQAVCIITSMHWPISFSSELHVHTPQLQQIAIIKSTHHIEQQNNSQHLPSVFSHLVSTSLHLLFSVFSSQIDFLHELILNYLLNLSGDLSQEPQDWEKFPLTSTRHEWRFLMTQ